MGGVAEKMLAEAMDALSGFNVDLAHRVVSSDPRLDALQREIEENAILTIARRQPLAVDLRECIAAIRISGDIERVGDLAKNIAKRTLKIVSEARVPRAIVGLKSMHEIAAMRQGRAGRLRLARHRAGARGLAERFRSRRAEIPCSAISSPS
jgi:phosphate transport system protein